MDDLFSFERFLENIPKLAIKLPITYEIVFVSFILGAALALALAVLIMKKIPVINQIIKIFISYERGTPMLVQLLVVYYGFPLIIESISEIQASRWERINFVYITFILNQGAFLCEIFKSAISSIPKVQIEAAYSCGLTKTQTFFKIILPQALRVAFPNLGIDFLGLFQETSLVFMIGAIDIFGLAQAIGSNTGYAVEAYLIVVIIFALNNFIFGKLISFFESKMSFSRKIKSIKGGE